MLRVRGERCPVTLLLLAKQESLIREKETRDGRAGRRLCLARQAAEEEGGKEDMHICGVVMNAAEEVPTRRPICSPIFHLKN